MKKSNIAPWLSASVVFLLLGFAAAQQKPAQPAEVPIDQEPHHHLVFENEYVRVFKVEVAPHEATLVHRHTRDYVVVTIGDAEVTNAVVGKEPKKWNFKDGDVTFLPASGDHSFAHKAVNDGKKPFVNLTIEFLRGKLDDKWLNPQIQEAFRFLERSLNSGRKTGGSHMHEQGFAWHEVHGRIDKMETYHLQHNGDFLLVAASEVDLNIQNRIINLKAGEVQWVKADSAEVLPAAKRWSHFLTFEW